MESISFFSHFFLLFSLTFLFHFFSDFHASPSFKRNLNRIIDNSMYTLFERLYFMERACEGQNSQVIRMLIMAQDLIRLKTIKEA